MKTEDVKALLTSERGRSGFSHDQRAALWGSISAAVDPLALSAPPETTTPPAPPLAAAAAAPASASLAAKVGTMVVVALLGAGAGAGLHAQLAEPRVVVVEHEAPAAISVASIGSASAPVAAVVAPIAEPAVAEPAVAPSVERVIPRAAAAATLAPRSEPSVAPRDPFLARERTLLDMARTALSRGDTGAAIQALDTHAREFPGSQLAEEREVLAIQALASAGRPVDARARAATFRVRYPKSVLLPIVDESTR